MYDQLDSEQRYSCAHPGDKSSATSPSSWSSWRREECPSSNPSSTKWYSSRHSDQGQGRHRSPPPGEDARDRPAALEARELRGEYQKPGDSSAQLLPQLQHLRRKTAITEAKEEAGRELGLLAHKLNDKDRGDFVLKHVIEMAHDDDNEDNRIVAVQLFSSMSECFGKNLCEQFIGL